MSGIRRSPPLGGGMLKAVRKLHPECLRWKKSNPNWVLVSFGGRADGDKTACIVVHRGTWHECARFGDRMPMIAASDGPPTIDGLAIMPIPVWNDLEAVLDHAGASEAPHAA